MVPAHISDDDIPLHVSNRQNRISVSVQPRAKLERDLMIPDSLAAGGRSVAPGWWIEPLAGVAQGAALVCWGFTGAQCALSTLPTPAASRLGALRAVPARLSLGVC